MKQDDEELEVAKELFKEGLKRIFQVTQKVVEKVVEAFGKDMRSTSPKKKNKMVTLS